MQTIQTAITKRTPRPHIAVKHADTEQPAQLARVKSRVAPLLLTWFASKKVGDSFYISEPTAFVWQTYPEVAPDSPRRILSQMKRLGELGELTYKSIGRSGLYCVAVKSGEGDK